MSRILAITLADDSFQRAHYGLVMAAGALSLGREVVLFAGGLSVAAVCRDWRALAGSGLDDTFSARGVAGFETLRDAVVSLGCEVFACEAGLRSALRSEADLYDRVQVCGVTRFLERVGDGQIVAI